MWPFLAGLMAAGAVGIHLWWRRRLRELQTKIHNLEEANRAAAAQQQRALDEVHAQQDALFNSMREGVLVLDRDGRVQLVNEALRDLTGISGDIRGQSVLQAFRMHQLNDLVQRVAAEGRVEDVELEWPGNRQVQVNAASILDQEKRSQGVILVFHDLTRLKQLENTRQEFVANVSHELRTPLSIIKGYVETLIDGAKDDPSVAPKFLQTILKHADRLTYLIEDLLTLSHLESGRAVLNFNTVELARVAGRVLDDLQTHAQAKRIHLRNNVPDELTARADADRLQQVLFNLVDNGIKYGCEGGFVEISAQRLDVQTVEFAVADDGPGIPTDAVERIFERFYRVDRARSREQGGTGLGLSIVKHIVQAHGGRVWVDSEPERGSKFRFTLTDRDA